MKGRLVPWNTAVFTFSNRFLATSLGFILGGHTTRSGAGAALGNALSWSGVGCNGSSRRSGKTVLKQALLICRNTKAGFTQCLCIEKNGCSVCTNFCYREVIRASQS